MCTERMREREMRVEKRRNGVRARKGRDRGREERGRDREINMCREGEREGYTGRETEKR